VYVSGAGPRGVQDSRIVPHHLSKAQNHVFPLFIANSVQDIDMVLEVLLRCEALAAHPTDEFLFQEVEGVHVSAQVGGGAESLAAAFVGADAGEEGRKQLSQAFSTITIRFHFLCSAGGR